MQGKTQPRGVGPSPAWTHPEAGGTPTTPESHSGPICPGLRSQEKQPLAGKGRSTSRVRPVSGLHASPWFPAGARLHLPWGPRVQEGKPWAPGGPSAASRLPGL